MLELVWKRLSLKCIKWIILNVEIMDENIRIGKGEKYVYR